MGGGSGPYDRALVFARNKLVFCGIPKAGIAQWLQFLRFTLGAKDYQSEPYNKQDTRYFYLDKMQPFVQQEIWRSAAAASNNNTWTRAIFIREPAERLLSAYLDKVAPKAKRAIQETRHDESRANQSNISKSGMKWATARDGNVTTTVAHGRQQRHRGRLGRLNQSTRIQFDANFTFAHFVDALAWDNVTRFSAGMFQGRTGLSWHSDPHWRPQAWSCGLSEDLSRFDYIGSLDDKAAYHTRALLRKVGLWDSHGIHYRVSQKGHLKGNRACTWPPSPPPDEHQWQSNGGVDANVVGFQQQGTNSNDRHNRNSQSKLEEYYTPEIMEKVRKIYWMDLALWDAIQELNKEGKTHGRDVAMKLNTECEFV